MEDLWSQLLTLYHFSSLLFSDITHFSSTFCDHSLKFSRIPPCFLLSVALQSSRNSFLNCKPVTCLPLLTRKWRSRSQAAFASMRKGWVTKGRVSRTGEAHSSSYGHWATARMAASQQEGSQKLLSWPLCPFWWKTSRACMEKQQLKSFSPIPAVSRLVAAERLANPPREGWAFQSILKTSAAASGASPASPGRMQGEEITPWLAEDSDYLPGHSWTGTFWNIHYREDVSCWPFGKTWRGRYGGVWPGYILRLSQEHKFTLSTFPNCSSAKTIISSLVLLLLFSIFTLEKEIHFQWGQMLG